MTKKEFLSQLRKGLSGLSRNETEERLTFYSEMIDDRMEEGLSEEDAVFAAGAVDEIVSQIVGEGPAREKARPKRRLKSWEIVLLALGSPVWLSLLIAALAVIISLYASLWSVIISLWAVFAALAAGAVGGVISGIVLSFVGFSLSGIAMSAAGIACAGLCIFLLLGCDGATKGIVMLTKKTAIWTKNCFRAKEEA